MRTSTHQKQQAADLFAANATLPAVAAAVGVSLTTAQTWRNRWRAGGVVALAPRRRAGRRPRYPVTPEAVARIRAIIRNGPQDAECWTQAAIVALIREHVGPINDPERLRRIIGRDLDLVCLATCHGCTLTYAGDPPAWCRGGGYVPSEMRPMVTGRSMGRRQRRLPKPQPHPLSFAGLRALLRQCRPYYGDVLRGCFDGQSTTVEVAAPAPAAPTRASLPLRRPKPKPKPPTRAAE